MGLNKSELSTSNIMELGIWRGVIVKELSALQSSAFIYVLDNKLSDKDIDEFIENINNKQPQLQLKEPQQEQQNNISLESISKIENVNALCENQTLTFFKDKKDKKDKKDEKQSLIVIYGRNGSGKSGYTRILKQIGRARGFDKDGILPNVHNVSQTDTTPKAKIKYYANGKSKTFEWNKNEEKDLHSINIFDSKISSIYVNSNNDVLYEPLPMKRLKELATFCDNVSKKLHDKIETKKLEFKNILDKNIDIDTDIYQKIIDLKINIEDIKNLAIWNDEQEKDLNVNPEKLKNNLDGWIVNITQLQEVVEFLSVDSFNKLQELQNKHDTCKTAAKKVAESNFAKEPLKDIGCEEWKILWNAAQEYSKIAYPDKESPLTDKSHCVLCQQKLGDEAIERLGKFAEFVSNNTKQQEEQALKKLNEFKKELSDKLETKEKYFNFCKDALDNKKLAEAINDFFIKAKNFIKLL